MPESRCLWRGGASGSAYGELALIYIQTWEDTTRTNLSKEKHYQRDKAKVREYFLQRIWKKSLW